MQTLFVLLAMGMGLLYNYNFVGFDFRCMLCLFAGLFMIMPSLFNIKLSHISVAKSTKTIIGKDIIANFILLPTIAIIIGIISQNFAIAAGLFLLSVLSGGGMVMNWIKESNSNIKIGFLLFVINLLLLPISFYLFKQFGINFSFLFDINNYVSSTPAHLPAEKAFLYLIIIPFITSFLLLKFVPIIPNMMQKNRKTISNISIFLIVFYLFALEKNKVLFDIELIYFIKSFVAVIVFYALTFIVAKQLFNTRNPEERAAFWHIVTRYITLALVLSLFLVKSFGPVLILPIMMAYFVQLPLSIFYSNRYNYKTESTVD